MGRRAFSTLLTGLAVRVDDGQDRRIVGDKDRGSVTTTIPADIPPPC